MIKSHPVTWFLFAFIAVAGCRKPYQPPEITSPGSYLVVEGIINSGTDSTFIKLSKTVPLSAKSNFNPVLNAAVTVESSGGASYVLTSTTGGIYASAGLNLDNTLKYRLRIKTAEGGEYVSDFVPVLNAPPIDTISHTVQSAGIQLYVSTHDVQNSTRYYRWDYQETWVFHSKYYSFYKSNGDTVIERNFPAEQVYQCWRSDTSSTIVVGTSSGLSKSVISNQPLTFVPSTSEKLDGALSIVDSQSAPTASTYSILVKQYALTGDAYTYWQNLKKNTEQLGGIFDAQPSEISGNIHSVSNPAEPVIGYISAGTTSSKRAFIKNQEVPAAWLPTNVGADCVLDSLYLHYLAPGATVAVNQENEYFNVNRQGKYYPMQIPVSVLFNKFGQLIGHTGSSPECVDCTLRGTNKEPAFWQ